MLDQRQVEVEAAQKLHQQWAPSKKIRNKYKYKTAAATKTVQTTSHKLQRPQQKNRQKKLGKQQQNSISNNEKNERETASTIWQAKTTNGWVQEEMNTPKVVTKIPFESDVFVLENIKKKLIHQC